MHIVHVDQMELAAYQLKNLARTWFDQWRDKYAPFAG